MDTRTLYDLLVKDGIDPKDDDIYFDCVDVWRRYMLTNADVLKEYVVDWMIEALEDQDSLVKVARNLSEGYKDIKRLQDTPERDGPSYHSAMARCLASELSTMGSELMLGIHAEATSYIKFHAEDWLNDVRGYVHDMEEGMREDAEYDRVRDDQLTGDAF